MPKIFFSTIAVVALAACVSTGAQVQRGSTTGTNPQRAAGSGGEIRLTGVISDSLCGRQHYVLSNGTPAECTRYCVAKGANYILIAGDKIYTLLGEPGAALVQLAGQQARITGTLADSNAIEIKSISAAGKEEQEK